jgi:hypothetical protein
MSSMASGHAISESFDIAPTANSPHNMSNHTEAACSALIEATYPSVGVANKRYPEQVLLSNQAWKTLRPHDRRWIPLAGERVGLRTIKAHGQIERSLRCGEPVDLFVRPWALVLEVEVERASLDRA